ncbi:MAG TPA: metallophosphoesterase [Steroidobacter sp.]|uniref:metallophosphoesterase family protein n=1 Tax=Steroidobacter sp. TaxID=1978227 RepID=UPI002ED96995
MSDRPARLFALSDVHVDYDVNARWVRDLSRADYRDDILILAGDITHKVPELASCLSAFATRFAKVLFVPGNHELWVMGEAPERTSLDKFADVVAVAEQSGICMQPYSHGDVLIVPLLGWYDYSFGAPSEDLYHMWMDFHACRWPSGFQPDDVSAHFTKLNSSISVQGATRIVTFSHFLPRIDLLPSYVSSRHRLLDPVLGSTRLERQLRELGSSMHVYGHSHINRRIELDGVTYINNAFGYPGEERIAARGLLCIDQL